MILLPLSTLLYSSSSSLSSLHSRTDHPFHQVQSFLQGSAGFLVFFLGFLIDSLHSLEVDLRDCDFRNRGGITNPCDCPSDDGSHHGPQHGCQEYGEQDPNSETSQNCA